MPKPTQKGQQAQQVAPQNHYNIENLKIELDAFFDEREGQKKQDQAGIAKHKANIERMNEYLDPKAKVNFEALGVSRDETIYGADLIRSIEIPTSEEGDEYVRAIVLGAALDAHILAESECPNGAGSIPPEHYMVMNVMAHHNSNRDFPFHIAIAKARQATKEAFEQAKNGNQEMLERYATNLVNFMKKYAVQGIVATNNAASNTYERVLSMYTEVKNKGVFANIPKDDAVERKIGEKNAIISFANEAREKKLQLFENLPAANSEERKAVLLDILSAYVLRDIEKDFYSTISKQKENELREQYMQPEFFEEHFMNHLKEHFSDEEVDLLKKMGQENIMNNHWMSVVYTNISTLGYDRAMPSYQSEKLTSQYGKNQYIAHIKSVIEGSDTFKQLMSEGDVVALQKELSKLELGNKQLQFQKEVVKVDQNHKQTVTKEVVNGVEIDQIYVEEYEKRDLIKNSIYEYYLNREFSDQIESEIIASTVKRLKPVLLNQKLIEKKQEVKAIQSAFDQYLAGSDVKDLDFDVKYIDGAINHHKSNEPNGAKNKTAEAFINHQTVYLLNQKKTQIYRLSMDTKTDGSYEFHMQPVNAIPLVEGSAYNNRIVLEANEIVAKNRLKPAALTECATRNGLSVYLGMMKDAFNTPYNKEPMKVAYQAMYTALDHLNSHLEMLYAPNPNPERYGRYKNIEPEQYVTLMKLLDDSLASANAYAKLNPYDESCKRVTKMIQDDIALFSGLELKNGGISVQQAIRNKKSHALELQKTRVSACDHPVGPILRDTNVGSVTTALLADYIAENAKIYIGPDGVEKVEDDYYFNQKGEILKNREIPDFVEQHATEAKDYILSRYRSYAEMFPDRFDREIAISAIKNVFPNYELDEEGKIARALSVADSDLNFYSAAADAEIEMKIAVSKTMGGNHFNRFYQAFIKIDGSEESRKWNRTFVALCESDDPLDRKKATEMALDKVAELNLAEFDLSNDKLPLEQPKKLYEFGLMAPEIVNILNTASKVGVDIYAEKYDAVRKNFGVMEALAGVWRTKWRMMCSPMYELIDLKQISQATPEQIVQIGDMSNAILMHRYQKTGNDRLVSSSLTDLVTYNTLLSDSNGLLDKMVEGGTLTEAFDTARQYIRRDITVEPGNHGIADHFKKLNENKRTRFGSVIENSDLYKAVLASLQNYQNASMKDKEARRVDIVKACDRYIDHRNKNNERTKLVADLKKFATELQPTTIEITKQVTARAMVADYQETLTNAKEANRSADDKMMADYITNPENWKIVVDVIAKTTQCQSLIDKPNETDRNDLIRNAFRSVEDYIIQSNQEKYDMVSQALKAVKDLNTRVAFDLEGHEISEKMLGQYLLMNNQAYMKSKEGGLLKVSLDMNEPGKFAILTEKVEAIPLTTNHPIANESIHKANAKVLGMDQKKVGNDACEAHVNLPHIADVLRKMHADAKTPESDLLMQKLTVLNQLIEEQYQTKNCLVGDKERVLYSDMKPGQFQQILDAYKEVKDAASAYGTANPSGVINQLVDLVNKDLALIGKLPLQDGEMPFAKAIYHKNTNAYEAQESSWENELENNRFAASFYNVEFNLVKSLMDNFKMTNPDVKYYPDGTVCREGDCYFNRKGEVIDRETERTYLANHIDDVYAILKQYNFSYETIHSGEKPLDPKLLKRELRTVLPKYQLPSNEEIQRRQAQRAELQEKVHMHYVKTLVEGNLAGGIDGRYPLYYIDLSCTKEARENNREFSNNLHGTHEQRKHCLEQMVDRLAGFAENIYEILPVDDDAKLIQNIDTILGNRNFISEIQNILKDATEAGINLQLAKYDQLRSMAGTMEDMAFLISMRIDSILAPTYPYMKLEQFNSVKLNKLQDFEQAIDDKFDEEKDGDRLDMRYSAIRAGVGIATRYMQHVKLTNEPLLRDQTKTHEQRTIEHAKTRPFIASLDNYNDNQILNARAQLERITAKNAGQLQTPAYQTLIQMIDEFRIVSDLKKESYAIDIRNACEAYAASIPNNQTNKELLAAVNTVKTMTVELQQKASELGLKTCAQILYDELAHIDLSEADAKKKEALNKIDGNKLIKMMTETATCKKYYDFCSNVNPDIVKENQVPSMKRMAMECMVELGGIIAKQQQKQVEPARIQEANKQNEAEQKEPAQKTEPGILQ